MYIMDEIAPHWVLFSEHQRQTTPTSLPLGPFSGYTRGQTTQKQAYEYMSIQYEYTITYRPGKDQGHADTLSRLPLPQTPTVVPVLGNLLLLLEHLDTVSPVTARSELGQSPGSSEKIRALWLALSRAEGRVAAVLEEEGRVECAGWLHAVGSKSGHATTRSEQVVQELHETHPGIARMKCLARSYVWSRLHLDYAGPFLNRVFLVLVDAHSKWLEVVPVSAATSMVTIEKLRTIFTTHRLPKRIVTVFTSEASENFLHGNGIVHT